jgi:uncharacterized membrane protein YkoI
MGKAGTKVQGFLCAVALAISVNGFAFADGEHDDRREDAEKARRGAESGEFVPLATIVAGVRARYPGEIVETEFESEDGQIYYEFHILRQNGRLIEIKVDARSGRLIGDETDDD